MFSTMRTTLFCAIGVNSIALQDPGHLSLVSRVKSEQAKCAIFDGIPSEALPTTWDDAREAFRSLCEEGFEKRNCVTAEQQVFAGYPTGNVDMTIDADLCARLEAIVGANVENTAGERETALLARVGNKLKASHTNKELDSALEDKKYFGVVDTRGAGKTALLARVGNKLKASHTNKELDSALEDKKYFGVVDTRGAGKTALLARVGNKLKASHTNKDLDSALEEKDTDWAGAGR